MINIHTLKPLFILWLIVNFTSFASPAVALCEVQGNGFTLGVQGKSFNVTFSMDEEEYTDTLTFGSDGCFTMAFFSKIENSSGFYIDLLGVFFFAHFSGSFPTNPFSFSFYGIYLSPDIVGITSINFGGSQYIGNFFGTEI